jgi:hypothetical protein
MVELKKNDYCRVLPVFETIKNSKPVIFSVIDGNVEGSIYVNDPENPETALISLYDMFFLNGKADQQICESIYDLLASELFPAMSEDFFDFYCMTDELREIMEKLFSTMIQCKPMRKTFIYNKDSFEQFLKQKDIPIPTGYEFKSIDQDFIDMYKLDKGFWDPSTKRFGVALVNGDEIISECTAVFVGGGQAEISIDTKEEYRNKGYATAVCAEFIQHCITIDLLPNWGCWDFRTASIALAKRLGFVENPDCMVFGIKK